MSIGNLSGIGGISSMVASRGWHPAAYSLISSPLSIYAALPGRSIITEFQGGHGWNSNAGGSQNYNATTDPIIGSQHFSLTTNPAGTYKYCQRTVLASTVDMTAKNMAVLMRVNSLSNLDEMQLFLFNGGGTSVYRKFSNLEGSQSTKWFYDGEWCLFTVPLDGDYADTGAFDISAVTGIRIAFDDDNSGAVTVYLQAVATFDRPATKHASIIFDDGHDSVFDIAKDIMVANGVVGAIAVPHDQIGSGSYMDIGSIKTLAALGWEVVAHATGNDQTADNEAVVTAYMAASRAYFHSARINVHGWVYAGGEYGAVADNPNATIKSLASDAGFVWARTINEASYETLPAADPMKLRVIYVTNADMPASVNALVDQALATGGWPILVFHRIVASGADETTKYLTDDFTTIVEHMAGISGLQVQTPTAVLRAFQEA